jgi:hypothetical protein
MFRQTWIKFEEQRTTRGMRARLDRACGVATVRRPPSVVGPETRPLIDYYDTTNHLRDALAGAPPHQIWIRALRRRLEEAAAE